MNLIRANMQLASEDNIDAIIRLDAEHLSSNSTRFIKENRLGYYILTNTWLMIVKQYSKYGWMRLLDRLLKEGLISAIRAADESASCLVHGDSIEDGLFRSIYLDISKNYFLATVPESPVLSINKDPLASALFVLRYPKRFSPLSADRVINDSLLDFINTENRTKLIQRRGYPQWLIAKLHDKMESLLDWDELCSKLEGVSVQDIEFTQGVGFDSKSSLGSKLVAVSETHAEYFLPIFGVPTTGAYNIREESKWRFVKVAAVPKSYKAARIIAMEDTYRQSVARRYFSICDRYTPRCVPIHNQMANQVLAMEASVDGRYSTTDLSHASDCIAKSLGASIFPARFYKIVERVLGTHTLIKGVPRLMQQLSTAGNSMTFWLESMVFYTIALVAEDLYISYSGETLDQSRVPSVYGDDIIAHRQCADTLHDILRILGFQVNDAKSFWSLENLYRESCGIECIDGMDVSSLYYPRTPLKGTLTPSIKLSNTVNYDGLNCEYFDSTVSLVSLQHRLYTTCYEASRFVYECIREAHPKMTTSVVNSEVGDCWEYEDTCVLRSAPAGHIELIPTKVGPLSGIIYQYTRKMINEPIRDQRTAKYLPRVTYTVKEVTDFERRLYDAYRYQSFLKRGPRYSDELMKLLGVTERPKPIEEIFGQPQIKWGLIEVDYK